MKQQIFPCAVALWLVLSFFAGGCLDQGMEETGQGEQGKSSKTSQQVSETTDKESTSKENSLLTDAGSTYDKVVEQAGRITRDSMVQAGKLSNWSKDRLNKFLDNLDTYKPMVKKAGFVLSGVRVRMGIVPAVTIINKQTRKLTETEWSQLHKRYKDDRIKSLFLDLLHRAQGISISGYQTRAVWVTISVNPHAVVVFE